jgi:DNA repair protein RadA/Sms
MVDTVLYFEGDRHASYRILRAVKNRFGSTNEIGVFEMCNTGLEEVKNPSEYMLNGRPEDASGSVVACSMEGTRPILVEIQALVCQSNFGIPRRTAVGTDFNRVNLLMAVLEKKVGLRLAASDAYVNIAGGMKMTEPAIDLGICLAIVSSAKDIVIPDNVMVFGEVGLSGEIRAVNMAGQRVQEAKKLGFGTVVLPEVCRSSVGKVEGINLVYVSQIRDAMKQAISKLQVKPQLLLNDAVNIPGVDIEQVGIIKGDTLSASIAAASIIAKVTRDRLMVEYDSLYPGYGFAKNMGYGTAEHIDALKKIGPCAIHRRTFIKNFV